MPPSRNLCAGAGGHTDCCRLWDIAKVIPKERISPSESFEGLVKFLRSFMFLIIFALLLACVTLAQASVLLLVAGTVKVRVVARHAQTLPKTHHMPSMSVN